MTTGTIEAILIVTPCETLKVLLIDDRLKSKMSGEKITTLQRFKQLAKEQGPKGFYKGLTPTILR